jgi:hypothetical protein
LAGFEQGSEEIMPAVPHPPEAEARAEAAAETTTRPAAAIARGAGLPAATARKPPLTPLRVAATRRAYEKGLSARDLAVLNDRSEARMNQLARANGWARAPAPAAPPPPPAAPRRPRDGKPALTRRRLAATRAGYEKGLSACDLGVLNGRTGSWLNQLARARGWARAAAGPHAAGPPAAGPPAAEPPAAERPEIAEIAAALRGGASTRRTLNELWNRASALVSADVLTGGDPRGAATVLMLARLRRALNDMPHTDEAAEQDDDGRANSRSLDEVREEFARRLQAIYGTRDPPGLPE